jgi:hypothetical protein
MANRKPKKNYAGKTNESSLHDRCQTPDYALDPLFDYLKPEWTLWEPARGEGYLERALQAQGRTVVSGDLITGQNFFDDDHLPIQWDAMVTNPPFSVKYKWMARAYRLGKPFALIVPIDTLGAAAAQRLFKHYGFEWIFFIFSLFFIILFNISSCLSCLSCISLCDYLFYMCYYIFLNYFTAFILFGKLVDIAIFC